MHRIAAVMARSGTCASHSESVQFSVRTISALSTHKNIPENVLPNCRFCGDWKLKCCRGGCLLGGSKRAMSSSSTTSPFEQPAFIDFISRLDAQKHRLSSHSRQAFIRNVEQQASTHRRESGGVDSDCDEIEPEQPALFAISGAAPKKKFRLPSSFVSKFATEKPPFGFNGLGELVYQRTYSRVKDDSTKEQWHETVERVVNGTFNMQKEWIEQHGLGWNNRKALQDAKEMYRRIFHMKFLPPGRGLWAMGTVITEERRLYAALNNCGFVSTDDLDVIDPSQPFCFLMDAAMLGVGVGFDTKGAGKVLVKGVAENKPKEVYVIPDNRDGWVYSVRLLLEAFFNRGADVEFDYSEIRPEGLPIKGFGGVSAGPEPLRLLHERIRRVMQDCSGKPISGRVIVDLMNMIGQCVVAGNVRRTAEIAFGSPNDEEYIDLKNYKKNPDRAAYGWTSNNSVFAEIGMDYGPVCERIAENGEPGFAWLTNMQNFGRMNGIEDDSDKRAMGGNPCLEQTLESYELCCLVETFPNNHENMQDFVKTLRYAYLYAKTVTLGKTHWPLTNRVLLRNRRIGCSMSGIAQFIGKRGVNDLREWSEAGYKAIQDYDKEFSDLLAIPRSIKTTCVKPSGTVSLLAGATPGLHYPESRFYVRRIQLPKNSELIPVLREGHYDIEDSAVDPSAVVVAIPVDAGEGVRTAKELSVWEQLSLAAFMQRHWADNQVSCTATFDPATEGHQLKHALDYFQYQLKGISFLPRMELGAYKQMPYEEIDEGEYIEKSKRLRNIDFSSIRARSKHGDVPDKFCEADSCEINAAIKSSESLLKDPVKSIDA